jgi:hypothetical protein
MNHTEKLGSWQMARHLLMASRLKERIHRSTSDLLPAAVALVNLLFCALCENPIKEDSGGRSLSVFFFVQGWAMFLLTLTQLATNGAEVLRKTLLMPVTPSARLTFAFLSSMRNPLLLALAITDMFFLLVVHHQSVAIVIAIPLFVGLLTANAVALACLTSAVAIRRSRPPTIVAAYSILALLGILAITLLFHMPAAFGILPPMSWTAQGILAVTSGQVELAVIWGAASGLLLFLAGLVGRRYA